MKLLVLSLILLSSVVFPSVSKIMEDEEFIFSISCTGDTWDYTYKIVENVCKTYPKNRFEQWHMVIIVETALYYHLNPILLLSKLEQENSLVTNHFNVRNLSYNVRMELAMGYGTDNKKYRGFRKQVDHAGYTLRYWFNRYKAGYTQFGYITLLDKGRIKHDNAATYALYMYTPVYGTYKNKGYTNTGNCQLPELMKKFTRLGKIENPFAKE